ncbi:MAG: efflux RND transporter periplasmic adaptor subunit [Tepidisphaeraceae bacterium]
MRFAIVIVLLLALIGVGGALFVQKWKAGAGGGDGATVRVEPAAVGDLAEVVSAPGVVEPETMVAISARVSARITELPFKEGAEVKSGDIVARLDSTDIEANLRAAKARYKAREAEIKTAEARIIARQKDLEALQAQLTEKRRDLERQQSLLASKDVAQSVVDTAQSVVDQLIAQLASSSGSIDADRTSLGVLRANLDADAADIDRIQDSLSYTTLRSPIDGVITKLEKEVGELAIVGTTNTPGTEILTVADLRTMLIETKVDESAIAGVKVGQKASVRIQAYRNRVFDGTVQTVALAESTDTDKSKYYATKILLDTAGVRVLSGLTADVDIETQRHRDVVKVPSQAVLGRNVDDLPTSVRSAPEVDARKTLTTVVYRLIDGKAVATPVRVGPSDVTHTVIESGLKPGDIVVTGPYKVLETLKHDDKLKLETSTTQSTTKSTTTP